MPHPEHLYPILCVLGVVLVCAIVFWYRER